MKYGTSRVVHEVYTSPAAARAVSWREGRVEFEDKPYPSLQIGVNYVNEVLGTLSTFPIAVVRRIGDVDAYMVLKQ